VRRVRETGFSAAVSVTLAQTIADIFGARSEASATKE
jgi:hypothetical protein